MRTRTSAIPLALLPATVLFVSVLGCKGEPTPARVRSQGSSLAPAAPVDCLLYAAAEQRHEQSQLFSLDLSVKTTLRLGAASSPEIRGMAINPATGALYAISEGEKHSPPQLYSVDAKTGAAQAIGPVGFERLQGLSFRSTDGSLWSSTEDDGLVRIDPATGAGTLAFKTHEQAFSSLSWTDDGTGLYALEDEGRLSLYDPVAQTLTRLHDRLPEGVRAIQVRPDGNMLVLLQGNGEHDGEEHDDDDHPRGASFATYNLQHHNTAQIFTIRGAPSDLQVMAWPNRCGNPDPGGQVTMIHSISVDKTTVCPNDEVLVTVVATHPDGPPNPVDVSINQFVGATQYVQFTGAPGLRQLAVGATTFEGFVDHGQVNVTVGPCAPTASPVVRMNPSTFHPDTIEFTIANPADLPASATFQWDFGDGSSVTTQSLFVTHDYSESIPADGEHTYFTASVTVAGGLTIHKSLAILNRYAFNKRLRVLQPPAQEGAVTQVGTEILGDQTIRNLENTAINLIATQIEYQPCDTTQPSSFHPFFDSIILTAQQQVTRTVALGNTTLLDDSVCGAAVHYTGADATGLSAVANLYYLLKDNRLVRQWVSDPTTIAALQHVAALNGLADTAVITDEDIHTLVRQGRLAPMDVVSAKSAVQGTKHIRSTVLPIHNAGPTPNGTVPPDQSCDDLTEPTLGDPCNPACAPIRPDLVCSVSDDTTWVLDPAHVQNAQKGDSILSPGCGKIGSLLHTVGQHYSHMGIMSRDLYEVTNSTASEDMLDDDNVHDGVGGAAGITPMYLQYAWPGAIRQTIQQSFVDGSNLTFVTGGPTVVWNERPLSADPVHCGGDVQLYYPVVARVDPALRSTMQQIADKAGTDGDDGSAFPTTFFESAFHYRFFSYSQGNIGARGDAQYLSPAFYSQGTRPSVCSSFIWNELSDLGVPVSAREPDAHNMGMFTVPEAASGLFFYSEAQRQVGAATLYNTIYNSVKDKGGTLGQIVGAPGNYATQMVNCFAFDNCQHDGSGPQWMDPTGIHVGTGNAVSPDNILLWNIYPTNEPMIFRQDRYRRPYTWHAAAGTGCISGQVTDTSNNPVAGATVQIVGLQRRDGENVSTLTDAQGMYSLQAIPILTGSATYLLTVQKTTEGVGFGEGSTLVNSATPTCANGNMVLQPPAQLYRRVTLCGTIHIDNAGETSDPAQDAITVVCKVNQADPVQHVPAKLTDQGSGTSNAPDDEFAGHENVGCTLNNDNSVSLHLDSVLEGCDNDFFGCGRQIVQEEQDDIKVAPGQGQPYTKHLRNDDNDIWADFTFNVFNDCLDCNTAVSCP